MKNKPVCKHCDGSGRVPTKIYTYNKKGFMIDLEVTTTKCVCKEYLVDIQITPGNRKGMLCLT